MLLKEGADANLGDGRSFPLHRTATSGSLEIMELLVEAGVDVNVRNGVGNTALTETLTRGLYPQKTFNALMKLEADVNIANNKGMTPLMIAARGYPDTHNVYSVAEEKTQKRRCVQQICRLLKAGAQIGRINHLGNNSLQGSFKQNQKKVYYFQMLLYAAGETLDGPTVPRNNGNNNGVIHINVPKYFTELKERLDLKHLCREAVRKHLINLDPHEHLFGRIPQLGLPSIVTEYMLYDCSLESKISVSDID